MLSKTLKFMVMTLLAYLLHATVAQRIAIGGAAPNLALALTAVISVALGRKYTFVMALTIGYLMEIMLPALNYINMILYPVCAVLASLGFADRTERQLEERRTLGKSTKQRNPHLRTVLCALLSTSLFEFVNLFYSYLSGVAFADLLIGRAVRVVLYSAVLAGILQYPVRWWLGIYKLKKAR